MKKRFLIPLCILSFVALFSVVNIIKIAAKYYSGEKSYTLVAAEFLKTEKQMPVTVDFDRLKAEYPDVVGWLYCAGTPINYPVAQAQDNDYYLRRLIDGSYSVCGSIFMDFRNSSDFSDDNIIIYGHNMRNDAMFGCLDNYKNKEFFENHGEMYLLTPEKNYKILVNKAYTTNPDDKATYSLISENEKTITLSTCSYEYKDARYVVVGALEEI